MGSAAVDLVVLRAFGYNPGQARDKEGQWAGGYDGGIGGSVASGVAVVREITDEGAGRQFLKEHYGAWRGGMSKQEDAALAFYQSPGYELMNGQLRGSNPAATDKDLRRAREASKVLSGAIDKAPPLKEPLRVFRGFSAGQFGQLKPGQVVSDAGFVSTSLTKQQAGSFTARGKQAMAHIVLPAGTRVGGGSVKELILPPGSKLRVVSIKPGNVTEVQMELVQ